MKIGIIGIGNIGSARARKLVGRKTWNLSRHFCITRSCVLASFSDSLSVKMLVLAQ